MDLTPSWVMAGQNITAFIFNCVHFNLCSCIFQEMFRLNNNLTLSDLVIKYDCVSQSLDQSTFSDLTKLLQVVVTSSCLFFSV